MFASASKLILLLLMGVFALLAAARAEAEIRRFAIGNDARPWEEGGILDAIDTKSRAGWIQPRRTIREINLLQDLYDKGQLYVSQKPSAESGYRPGEDGRIWSLNIPVTENKNLFRLADGLSDTLAFDYFDRLVSNAGVSIIVDLGIPFPVSEISFYPLSFGKHIELFVRGYQLFATDGSPDKLDSRGEPIFTPLDLLDAVPANVDVVVRNSDFTPRHIRFIKLRITAPDAFELDQFEIRGEGAVRQATFTSEIIDAGDLANFGRIFWGAEEDPGLRLSMQTRIRRDDTGEWTQWSAPYDSSGQELAATGPGQFIQLRASFDARVPTARTALDSLAFEFSRPVLAREIAGRIAPREDVDLGTEQRFTYAVLADVNASDVGFDTVELATPAWASLQEVRIAGRVLPEDAYAVQSEKNLLILRLLNPEDRIESSEDVLELDFDTTVLIYGTIFAGRVSASWEADLLPQLVEEENTGALSVLGSESSLGLVLGPTAARPPVFTPNGDGINDRTMIEFRISQVIGVAPLQVRVYDLAGRFMATLLDRPSGSDSFRLEWDGRDQAGRTVPPGIYVYRVELEGDVETFARTGMVGIVY